MEEKQFTLQGKHEFSEFAFDSKCSLWEQELISLQKKCNEFNKFKNDYIIIQDWTLGYFSILPKEILSIILSRTDIKYTFLICKLFFKITMSDENLLNNKQIKQIKDDLYHRHKFSKPVSIHKFMSGISYDKKYKEWVSGGFDFKSDNSKHIHSKKTYKDRRTSNIFTLCNIDADYGGRILFKSNHGKKVIFHHKDPSVSPSCIIKKKYKVPNVTDKYILHKWIKWIRNNKILPEGCSREEMLAIFPYLKFD